MVITIISLVSVVTLTTVGVGRTRNNLKTAQAEVISAIKLTQSYALQGKTVSAGETPCGFGFMFSDEGNYRIFYVPAGSGMTCDEKNANASYRQYINESNSPTLEEYEIRNNIILKEGLDLSDTEVYFTVPHANVYNSSGSAFGGTLITLTDSKGDMERSIEIDERGSIEKVE